MGEKFKARGITKEGAFVFGYYVKGSKGSKDEVLKNEVAHYIVKEGVQPYDTFPHLSFTEIIKAPDRLFCIKNNKKIWENDIERYEQFVEGKSIGFMTATIFWSEEETVWMIKDEQGHEYGKDRSEDIEIIGNTHNIKE